MAEPGSKVEPPPEELSTAAELTLYFAELLDKYARADLFDTRISPGVWIGLRAYARGQNKADWEKYKNRGRKKRQQDAEEKARQKAGAK